MSDHLADALAEWAAARHGIYGSLGAPSDNAHDRYRQASADLACAYAADRAWLRRVRPDSQAPHG